MMYGLKSKHINAINSVFKGLQIVFLKDFLK